MLQGQKGSLTWTASTDHAAKPCHNETSNYINQYKHLLNKRSCKVDCFILYFVPCQFSPHCPTRPLSTASLLRLKVSRGICVGLGQFSCQKCTPELGRLGQAIHQHEPWYCCRVGNHMSTSGFLWTVLALPLSIFLPLMWQCTGKAGLLVQKN